jgi:hypothetical protein
MQWQWHWKNGLRILKHSISKEMGWKISSTQMMLALQASAAQIIKRMLVMQSMKRAT